MKPFQVKDSTGELRYNGAWLIKYKTPTGEWRKQIGGATFEAAEDKLQEIMVDIRRGDWVDPSQAKREIAQAKQETEQAAQEAEACQYKTFGDICDEYSRHLATRAIPRDGSKAASEDKKKSRLTETTGAQRSLAVTLKHLGESVNGAAPILPASTPIAELTPARLKRASDYFETIPRAALATRNLYLTYLKMLFKWAKKNPLIPLDHNPTEDLEAYRASGTRRDTGAEIVPEPDEVFTREDVDKILAVAFSERNKCYAYLLLTAFQTGLRKGELCGLTWRNVFVGENKRSILVRRSYDRPTTKSGKSRMVPMSGALVAALKEWSLNTPHKGDDKPVFPDADGNVRNEDFDWARLVRRYAIKAGVNRPGMRRHGHGTRHYFATQWLVQGATDAKLAEILGHKDTSLVHRVYCHFVPKDLEQAIDMIDLGRVPTTATTAATTGSKISAVPSVDSNQTESAPVVVAG